MQKLKEYNSDADEKYIVTAEKPKRDAFENKVNRYADCIKKAKGIANYRIDEDDIPFSKEYLLEKFTEIENNFENTERPAMSEGMGAITEDEWVEKYADQISEMKDFFAEIGWNKDFKDVADEIQAITDEEYSYSNDLQSAYAKSLSTPLIDQIMDQVPEHALLDIKTPLKKPISVKVNSYNPVKPRSAYTFFDFTTNEDYFDRQKKKGNTRTHISLFRQY